MNNNKYLIFLHAWKLNQKRSNEIEMDVSKYGVESPIGPPKAAWTHHSESDLSCLGKGLWTIWRKQWLQCQALASLLTLNCGSCYVPFNPWANSQFSILKKKRKKEKREKINSKFSVVDRSGDWLKVWAYSSLNPLT